jgi:lysozyme family protein
MTLAAAKAIYRAKYWKALCCDDLPAGVDYAVFDYGVNSGTARAAKVLRRIVGTHGEGATVDAATVALARSRDAKQIIAAVCDERLAFLRRLKTWTVFGVGWGRRVAEVKAAALAMAARLDGAKPAQPRVTMHPKGGGKAVVPINKAAQRTTVGTVIATGAAAAQQAHHAGTRPVIIVGIVLAAAALALAAWAFWLWRRKRQQETPVSIMNT